MERKSIQEIARDLIDKYSRPLSSKFIANEALENGLITSNAANPIASLSATIEKNIKQQTYNKPRLKFVYSEGKRLIDIDSDSNVSANVKKDSSEKFNINISVPKEVKEKLDLAVHSGLCQSYEETISLIILKGLESITPQIRESILTKLKILDN